MFGKQGVGVEKQDVLALGLFQCLVVGLAEAHIALVGDEVELRVVGCGKLLSQVGHRMVCAEVVDHKHFELVGRYAFAPVDGEQALLNKVLDVVTDYDDG